MRKEKIKIGESLKRFRHEQGLSQKAVAEKLGITPQAYYRYESDKFVPTADVIIGIAQAYDVSADYILGLTDKSQSLRALITTESDKELIQAAINCRDAIERLNSIFQKRDAQANSAEE